MRTTAIVLLLVLGAFSSVASMGFHISDEATLGAAARSLYAGRAEVREFPAEYYEPYGWHEQHRVVLAQSYTAETRAGAVLAYPAFLVLEAWSLVAPVHLLLVLVAIGSLAGAAVLWRIPTWRAGSSARMRLEAGAITIATALLVGPNAARLRPIDPLWHAPIALQLTSLFVVATGVALLRALIEQRHGAPAASWATAILCAGTSVPLWAFGQKYHGMQVGLVGLVVFLRFSPHSGARAHASAYAVAGLAAWIHPRAGGLLLLALLGVDLARALARWRSWRALAPKAAACGAALALGLAGFAVENTLLYGAPHVTGYALSAHVVPPASPASPMEEAKPIVEYSPAPAAQTADRAFRGVAAEDGVHGRWWLAVWLGPPLLVPGIDVQFGILMLAPLVALAPLGVGARARRLDPLDATLLIHMALVVAAYGPQAAAPGVGSLDSRYMHVLFPALALYAALAIARSAHAPAPAIAAAAMGAVCAIVAAGALAEPGYTARVHTIRGVGLAAAALVVAWALVRRHLPHGRAYVDVPILGLGFAATALFLLSFLLQMPPRSIPTEPAVTHFLPLASDLGRALSFIGE